MKASKCLAILLTLATVALFTGCTKEYYTINEGVEMYQRDFQVKSSDWTVEEVTDVQLEDAYLLSLVLNVPEITRRVVENGNVTVSRRLTDNQGNVYWTPLPIVRADYAAEEDLFFSTYTDFEWGLGKVIVYITATDFVVGEEPAMTLRVTAWI